MAWELVNSFVARVFRMNFLDTLEFGGVTYTEADVKVRNMVWALRHIWGFHTTKKKSGEASKCCG